MIRALSLSVAIVFMASLSQLKAAEPATADTKESQMKLANFWGNTFNITEAFTVKGLAAFDISTLSAKTTGAWIVARIQPGGLSGSLHNQGSYIQAETGKTIDSGIRPRLVIRVGGQWKLMKLLSGKAPGEGRYQWKYPWRNHDFDRSFSILDRFSVFEGGPKNNGTVVCQFFENRSGAEQFASVTLIPDDWKTSVKPAHEYYVKHSAGFRGGDFNTLRKMALNDNPLIGLAALRRISVRTTEGDDVDRLLDLASSLSKYRQAVLILRLLSKNDDNSRDIVFKAISRAKNSGELRGLALGLHTSSAMQGQFIADLEAKQKLFHSLMEKWRNFDPSITDDKPSNKR